MRGFYGLFNNTLYELKEPTTVKDTVECFESCTSSEINVQQKSFEAEVKLTNMDDSADSNKEFFAKIVDKIKSEVIYELPKLAPTYKASVNYTLYDEKEDVIVDEGTATKTIEPTNCYFPLGLNDENEFVYRIVKNFTANFEFAYRSATPYGILKRESQNFVLFIHSIKISQVQAWARSIVPDECPSCGTVKEPKFSNGIVKRDPMIVIYDTEAENLEIKPMKFRFKPRRIGIKLQVVLNDYLMTASQEDINSLLRENIPVPEEPIIPSEPEEPETPTDPSDPVPIVPIEPSDPGKEEGGEDTPTEPTNPENPDGGNEENPKEPETGGEEGNGGETTPTEPESGNSGEENTEGGNTSESENTEGETKDPSKEDPAPTTVEKYVKCTSGTENALEIVADDVSDDTFDPATQIKLASVITDVSDAVVGEYVVLTEVTI